MNELIKRLVEQAHKDVRSDEEANGVCFKDYNSAFHTAFARLIASDCAELCADIDGGENMFSRAIRKHFGVTE